MNTQYRKNLKAVMEKSKEYTDNIYTLATNNMAGTDTSTNILAKTSNQGIWVGSDTGHWYYWNGTQYTNGGVYQATGIENNSIDWYKTKFIETGKNLFNKLTVIPNTYINYLNGIEFSNNSFFASDYIYIDSNINSYLKLKYYNGTGFQLAFYDTSKNYISGAYYGDTTNGIISIPNNAIYIRFSCANSFLDIQQLEYGQISTFYEEYKLILKYNDYNKNKIFYIGSNRQYTTLKDGIEEATKYMDSIVYVDDGIYDIINEFGTSFFENYTSSSSVGIILKNRVHIIFSSNSKVLCKYEGDNTNVSGRFSPFNAGEYGFTIENLVLECKNTRYAIHDEMGSYDTPYTNNYINCDIITENVLTGSLPNGIGGGLGKNGVINVNGCIFKSKTYTYSTIQLLTYHNSAYYNTAKSFIKITNCYLYGTMRFSWCGESTNITKIIASNNSITNVIPTRAEREQDVTENIELLQFNNEIRN